MPTGYTAEVVDGKITEFKDFALRCARAFGAMIEMRDDALDTPIPEEFKPDLYYSNRLKDAVSEHEDLLYLTSDEIIHRAKKEYQEDLKAYHESNKKVEETNRRIDSMLDKVEAWNPPSPDHQGMKKFMKEQLKMSREEMWRDVPKELVPQDWYNKELNRVIKNIKYFQEEMNKEEERIKSRNKWLKELRESLK